MQNASTESVLSKASGEGAGLAAPDDPREQRRILRNLLVISAAFMVHFTAFVGATNLQSSVNAEKGMGTVSLALSYGSLILSTIFLPAAMIRWLGCKGALIASFVSYMPYMAAQFAASYATVAPTALLLGLGGGPFWCAQCLYVCALAAEYARRRHLPRDVVVVRFFGIFYTVYEFGQIFGNLVSSLVLGSSWAPNNSSADVRELCGPGFCPGHNALTNPNLERPPDYQIYIVNGVYLALMGVSVLFLVFGLDSLRRYGGDDATGSPPLSGMALLRSAGQLLRERNQQLLLPLTFWLAVHLARQAFVSCAWGIRYIGYVMICYGAANSAAALVGGWAVKATGRPPVVLTAAVLHSALLLGLLHWRPHPDDAPLFFALAAVWGACDGVWNVQVNGQSNHQAHARAARSPASDSLSNPASVVHVWGACDGVCNPHRPSPARVCHHDFLLNPHRSPLLPYPPWLPPPSPLPLPVRRRGTSSIVIAPTCQSPQPSPLPLSESAPLPSSSPPTCQSPPPRLPPPSPLPPTYQSPPPRFPPPSPSPFSCQSPPPRYLIHRHRPQPARGRSHRPSPCESPLPFLHHRPQPTRVHRYDFHLHHHHPSPARVRRRGTSPIVIAPNLPEAAAIAPPPVRVRSPSFIAIGPNLPEFHRHDFLLHRHPPSPARVHPRSFIAIAIAPNLPEPAAIAPTPARFRSPSSSPPTCQSAPPQLPPPWPAPVPCQSHSRLFITIAPNLPESTALTSFSIAIAPPLPESAAAVPHPTPSPPATRAPATAHRRHRPALRHRRQRRARVPPRGTTMCGILSLGNEKAAYSLFRLWESAGYILAYGYSAYVCAAHKLIVVLGLLAVGVAGYVAIEVRLWRATKQKTVARVE
ncbi:UNC93-like protein [Gryllus bimaculatus]|nr:UNC93-like protein [Gryllus bimaculatus]